MIFFCALNLSWNDFSCEKVFWCCAFFFFFSSSFISTKRNLQTHMYIYLYSIISVCVCEIECARNTKVRVPKRVKKTNKFVKVWKGGHAIEARSRGCLSWDKHKFQTQFVESSPFCLCFASFLSHIPHVLYLFIYHSPFKFFVYIIILYKMYV